jgi:outer membrane lipoprotein-sorting protein
MSPSWHGVVVLRVLFLVGLDRWLKIQERKERPAGARAQRRRRLAQRHTPGVTILLLAAMAAHGGAADRPDPEEWLREAEAAYDRVTSYTAVFHKQQRVSGKLLPEETILLKCRRKPFSLYMKWMKAPYKGSELLYVAGWNQDRIRAHRGGILRFITRNLDPRDPGLMAGNLRPVTSTGIGYLLETVATNLRKAVKGGELTFSERGKETVYGRNTQVLEVVVPKERAKDYDGYRYVINQDVESKILVRIRIYDRDDQLVENYGYENLDLNAPLADADFDPKNPEYHF